MSDFVDLMLDGVICQCCGHFIGNPTGAPRSCGACDEPGAAERRALEPLNVEPIERAAETIDDDDDIPC